MKKGPKVRKPKTLKIELKSGPDSLPQAKVILENLAMDKMVRSGFIRIRLK